MRSIYTLTLKKEKKSPGMIYPEVLDTIEVDYDSDSFIHDIRIWSAFFNDFIPISENYLRRTYPSKFEKIDQRIKEEIEERLTKRCEDES